MQLKIRGPPRGLFSGKTYIWLRQLSVLFEIERAPFQTSTSGSPTMHLYSFIPKRTRQRHYPMRHSNVSV